MIRFVHGDILLSQAQTIVNPINTGGVMGAGLAKSIRKFYGVVYFNEYMNELAAGNIDIGKLWLYHYGGENQDMVLGFPTKNEDYCQPSKIEYIELGLIDFVNRYEKWEIKSIAFPMLGCGLGELSEKQVLPLMICYLKDLPIQIDIFTKYKENQEPVGA